MRDAWALIAYIQVVSHYEGFKKLNMTKLGKYYFYLGVINGIVIGMKYILNQPSF